MIISWNIIELNGLLKQAEVKAVILKYNVVLMGVLETRIREEDMSAVWSKLNLHNWELVNNYSSSNLGRIWIIYDASKIKLSIVESSMQYIHCKVKWCNVVIF